MSGAGIVRVSVDVSSKPSRFQYLRLSINSFEWLQSRVVRYLRISGRLSSLHASRVGPWDQVKRAWDTERKT